MKAPQLFNSSLLARIRGPLEKGGRRVSLIAALILAAIIYADYTFIMKSQLSALKALAPKIAKVKSEIETFNKDLVLMASREKQPQAQQQAAFSAKAKTAISEEQVHALYQEISELANKNNVRIVLLRPSRESPASKLEKESITGKLTPLALSMDLISEYQNLVNFIRDLENAETLLVIQNIRITPQQTDVARQKVDLIVKAYVQK